MVEGDDRSFETDCHLEKIDPDLITQVGKQNPGDDSVTNYLERASERISSPGNAGYALRSPHGEFLSFAWITRVDGYIVDELQVHLEGRRILIFDCYPPAQHRGKKYYSTTLKLIVEKDKEDRDRMVILCSEENPASVKGIVNEGFVRRFAIDTKVIFGRVWTARPNRHPAES
jgi:hypothetical protein